MDKFEGIPQPDMSDHVPPSPGTPGQWLSVIEAVAYCAQKGLGRNIKTIRRWAERSLKRPENAEVKVREQDTGFGFRYMIDRVSLDLKIKQELEFEAQKQADTPGHDHPRPDSPLSEVGAHRSPIDADPSADMAGQAQADWEEGTRRLEVQSIGEDFLKNQIDEKDRQIGELGKQLERRDDQIMTMLERDRETNILIRGLQDLVTSTLRLDGPSTHREHPQPDGDPMGDNRHAEDIRPGV